VQCFTLRACEFADFQSRDGMSIEGVGLDEELS